MQQDIIGNYLHLTSGQQKSMEMSEHSVAKQNVEMIASN